MGNCYSCKSSSSFDSIRVVHLNGYVEDLVNPATVSEVTGNPPKHFLCTLAQLLPGSKPLKPDTQLEPGHVYFLLPYSVLQSDTSPVDMVALATRLTSIAKRGGSKAQQNISIDSSANGDVVKKEFVLGSGGGGAYGEQISTRVRSWKPILESINEKSMDHHCE